MKQQKRRRRTKKIDDDKRRKRRKFVPKTAPLESVGSSRTPLPDACTSPRQNGGNMEEDAEAAGCLARLEATQEDGRKAMVGSNGSVTRENLWVGDRCHGWVAVKRCLRPKDEEQAEELLQESLVGRLVRDVLKYRRRHEADCSFLLKHVSRPLYLIDEAALVMEYFSGGTLHDALVRESTARLLTLQMNGDVTSHIRERVRRWLLPVFGAVDELHDRVGVGHCDLKSNNICFAADGSVKIIDFGRARRLDAGVDHNEDPSIAKDRAKLSYYLVRTGGPTYPEEEDVFALGILLFHVFVGRAFVLRSDTLVAMENLSKNLQRFPCGLQFERDISQLVSDCIDGRSNSSHAHRRLNDILNS